MIISQMKNKIERLNKPFVSTADLVKLKFVGKSSDMGVVRNQKHSNYLPFIRFEKRGIRYFSSDVIDFINMSKNIHFLSDSDIYDYKKLFSIKDVERQKQEERYTPGLVEDSHDHKSTDLSEEYVVGVLQSIRSIAERQLTFLDMMIKNIIK